MSDSKVNRPKEYDPNLVNGQAVLNIDQKLTFLQVSGADPHTVMANSLGSLAIVQHLCLEAFHRLPQVWTRRSMKGTARTTDSCPVPITMCLAPAPVYVLG